MATTKQKQAARQNLKRARQVQSARAHGEQVPKDGAGMSPAEENRLADSEDPFPKERKKALTDARHVRNTIARFDQGRRREQRGAGPTLGANCGSGEEIDVDVSERLAGTVRRGARAKKRKWKRR